MTRHRQARVCNQWRLLLLGLVLLWDDKQCLRAKTVGAQEVTPPDSTDNTQYVSNALYDTNDDELLDFNDENSEQQIEDYDEQGENDAEYVPPQTEHERLSSLLGYFAVDPPPQIIESDDAKDAADWYLDQLLDTSSLRNRLTDIFAKAKSTECRKKIATHLGYFLGAVGKEESMPFTRTQFHNECPEPVYEDWNNLPAEMHLGMIQNRTYQPPRNESIYIGDPNDLKLLYAVLTHDDAQSTIRLIQALYEPGHLFVVHVDAKETSADTYATLVEFALSRDWYVFVVPDPFRVRITWGGFSMVNATMQILQYAFGLLHDAENGPISKALDFHKVVHLASTSYPIASNSEIRHRFASYPLDANFLNIIMKPSRPMLWNYFVECDDAVHRIHHLPVLQNATAGANLFTSSQWWIISREFAAYLARNEPGTFVHQFLEYVQHVVVADETFFGTVLRHTSFCLKHTNRNFLHLQFDRWESDVPQEQRDEQKCMMKDPNHCGRSPTTMTADYADILELSDDLFARKFVDSRDAKVKDIVDAWRAKREASMQAYLRDSSTQQEPRSNGMDFEGQGVLIVAKETVNSETPLCMALGESTNQIQLIPCFYDDVVPNLLEGWETGAVVQSETLRHNRWEMTPCTSDGTLERDHTTGEIKATPGNYSVTGPRCMLKQMDGIRAGRCFDGDTGNEFPEGETLVFPCVHRWGQFLSVGDGSVAPKGSLFFHIPAHVIRMLARDGREQHDSMCLSVGKVKEGETGLVEKKSLRPIADWVDHAVVSIPCTETENVIEWAFVPYIVDDIMNAEGEGGNVTKGEDPKLESISTEDCEAPTCSKK